MDSACSCVFSDTHSDFRRLSGESVREDGEIVRRSLNGFVDYFGLCRKSFRKALTPLTTTPPLPPPKPDALHSLKTQRSPLCMCAMATHRVVHPELLMGSLACRGGLALSPAAPPTPLTVSPALVRLEDGVHGNESYTM